MTPAKKVILNTGFLYIKMLITMLVTLYSMRIVLEALGFIDYGIFILVAGVIAMLSFLNSAMVVSTQRYLSFYLGSNQVDKLKNVFKASIINHLIIGVGIIIVLEFAGIFLFDGILNIPPERISTAKLVYQFMIISTFFTINAVPFDAIIIARENMSFDAIVGISEALARLGIAIWLLYTGFDKLIFYAALIALLTIIVRLLKSFYCIIQYEECRGWLKDKVNFSFVREMFSFGGWNLFGALCSVSRNQGIAIILNIFFGAGINASYGIAYQVNGQLSTFSGNMLKALNPQIIKSEGGGERDRMIRLSMIASKFSFFLLAFFAIPLIFEMPFVLNLWLKDVPDYTIIFCQLILIGTLTNHITIGLQTAIQSTGKIKLYQSLVGSLLLLNLPIAYLLLKMKLPAYSVLISFVFIEAASCLVRIYIVRHITGMSFMDYMGNVINKLIPPTLLTIGILLIPHLLIESSYLRVLIITLFSIIILSAGIYTLGIDLYEKKIINSLFFSFWHKKSLV